MTEYHVGQEVYILGMNRRVKDGELPELGVITKVGRKLVTVKSKLYDWAREEQYRIENGMKNDLYGHGWILTPREWEEKQLRKELTAQLKAYGIIVDPVAVSTDKLEQILKVLNEEES